MTNDISHTQILSYQLEWQKKFENEKEKLKHVFGDMAREIEHIGSTSVEGLSSKPIIDIAVLIKRSADVDTFTEPLTKIGYQFHSLSTERYFFRKGEPIEFHVSIAYTDKGGFWERQILFRDYLRNHPEARDEYAKLKDNLLESDPTGRGAYIEGKSEFVKKILHLAEEEKKIVNMMR